MGGCCGVGCCRTSDDAPPVDEAPLVERVPSGSGYSPSSADKAGKDTKQRSSHSSLLALQAASLGSNTAMAGSEQQLSSKGGKLSDMLVDFVEQCSPGSPSVSLRSLEA